MECAEHPVSHILADTEPDLDTLFTTERCYPNVMDVYAKFSIYFNSLAAERFEWKSNSIFRLILVIYGPLSNRISHLEIVYGHSISCKIVPR